MRKILKKENKKTVVNRGVFKASEFFNLDSFRLRKDDLFMISIMEDREEKKSFLLEYCYTTQENIMKEYDSFNNRSFWELFIPVNERFPINY